MPEERQRESIDDLDALLSSLPPEIVDAVHALPDKEELIEVVMDDGNGQAGLRTAVWHDPARTVLQTTLCDEPQQANVTCTRETLPDGSAVMTWKSSYRDNGAKSWWCLLATPSGKRVSVTEWNSAEPGGSANRADPPLSVERLRAIAVDPVWDHAVD